MPRKRDKKIFENPEEMEDSELGDISFASHMSYLTNKRLHEIFAMCDVNGITAGTTLQLPSLDAYRATLWAVYINIESVLKPNQRNDIKDLFNTYIKKRFAKKQDPKTRYEMYDMLSSIHRLIIGNMQENQYFFRMETHPVKGIRKTLLKLGWIAGEKDGVSPVVK